MMPERTLGELIRLARQEAGLSQKELAALTGVSIQSLSALENGKQLPRISSLIEIASATKKPVPWFFSTPNEESEGLQLPPEFVANAWSREHLLRAGIEPSPEALRYLAEAVTSYERSRPEWIHKAKKLFEEGVKALEQFGLAQPEQVFHQMTAVVMPSVLRGAGRVARPDAAALVGRGAELKVLAENWREVSSGAGRAVFVSGPPGIGKTRLLSEFVSAQDCFEVSASCLSLPSVGGERVPLPLFPLIGLVRQKLGLSSLDARDHVDIVSGALESIGLSDLLPLACSLLSLPLPDGLGNPIFGASGWRRRLVDGLEMVLRAVSAKRPLLILLDDLQWIDPTSCEVLDGLLGRLEGLRVMFCLAARSGFSLPPQWQANTGIVSLALGPLSPAAKLSLIQQISSGRDISPTIHDRLVDSVATGTPLHVEQSTRAVLENTEYELNHFPLAESLEDVLSFRFGKLNLASRIVAEQLSVSGVALSVETLSHISPLGNERLKSALDELLHLGMVTEAGGGYRVSHDEIRRFLYSSLPENVRRQCHERLAWCLARRKLEPRVPEQIAMHFEKAGFTDEAREHWLEAASVATSMGADQEAVAYLGRALHLVGEAKGDLELQVRLLLAPRQLATEGYGSERVREQFESILSLCQNSQAQEKGMALWCAFLFHLVREEVQEAYELAQSCLSLAELCENRPLELEANLGIGASSIYLGYDLEEGYQAFCKGLAASDLLSPEERMGHAIYFGQAPDVAGRGYAAWNRVLAGRESEATQLIDEALTRATELKHPLTLACAHHFATVVYYHLDQPEKVAHHAACELRISQEEGFPLWLAGALMFAGWSQVRLAGADDGMRLIEQGLGVWAATGAAIGMPFLLSLKIDAFLELARPDSALEVIEQAESVCESTADIFYLPELKLLRARAMSDLSADSKQLVGLCKEAQDIAAPQSFRHFLSRALLDRVRYGDGLRNEDVLLVTQLIEDCQGELRARLKNLRESMS